MASDRVPMGRMFIDNEMLDTANRILASGQWIKGPESKAFGAEWAAYCGALSGTPCSNGSVALIAALHSLDVGAGDDVIVPSHTYIASATCISLVGANPVFVEIEEDYYTLDRDAVEAAITPQTKAIIGVHLYGQPIATEVFELAKERGIPVIEDSAQAHGTSLNGKRAGSFGDIATFSFFPSKNMAVGGDGGAILTNRKDLVQRVSTFIDHGRSDKYRNDSLGTNFRLSEIQCGVGRVQLKHLDSWVERRNEIAARYSAAFAGLEHLKIPKVRDGAVHAWHQYVIRVGNRESFQDHMSSMDVSTGIHYPIPCHLQPVYSEHPQGQRGSLEYTEAVCDDIVSIPVMPLLTDDEVQRVIDAVISWIP